MQAAGSSVLAAVLLTALKLVVGLATNSLGVLSEAAHSAFDLLAAGMTFVAVRIASAPPDGNHPYGHGKVENLSAFVETLLLLITCIWIIREAIDRLFFNPVLVRPSLWAAAVMVISIIVDYSRARMLMRVAQKHRSQALEADAVHFSTDILSSAVVLMGLGALFVGDLLPETSLAKPWLEKADAVAALGVSVIIIRISYSLGKRAVNVLLDTADVPVTMQLRAALDSLPCIRKVRGLRLRESGPDTFVELELAVRSGLLVDETAHIRKDVEKAVTDVVAHASTHIVFLSEEAEEEDRITRLRGLAASHGLAVHSVEMLELESRYGDHRHLLAEVHVEFPSETTLEQAHNQLCAFKEAFHKAVAHAILVTHIEPASGGVRKVGEAAFTDPAAIQAAANEIVANDLDVRDVHNVLLLTCAGSMRASFHCRMDGACDVERVHDVAVKLLKKLYAHFPQLDKITVQVEPFTISGTQSAKNPSKTEAQPQNTAPHVL